MLFLGQKVLFCAIDSWDNWSSRKTFGVIYHVSSDHVYDFPESLQECRVFMTGCSPCCRWEWSDGRVWWVQEAKEVAWTAVCSQAMLTWEKAASCSVCFSLLPSRALLRVFAFLLSPVYSVDLAEGVPFPISVSGHVHTCVCDVCQGPGLQQYSGSSHSGLESLSVRLRTS